MRMVKPVRMLWALGIAAVGILPLAGAASAQQLVSYYATDLSTERAGSILIWPKVIWDGSRDTVIQISNTGNVAVAVHCFYVDGSQGCSETDFDIFLTRQQPTGWVVSSGRPFSQGGLAPGLIPPVPQGFVGELKCIEYDTALSGPMPSNWLTGEATLVDRAGDVSQYNALSFQGNPSNQVGLADPSVDLPLDMTPTNPGGFYSACPAVLLFDHFVEGATDIVDGLKLSTELTLVPCQENLENQIPSSRTVDFVIFDEFENQFSTSVTINCYFNKALARISSILTHNGGLSTPTAYTRITSRNGGVIGMAEEFRNGTGAAAFNLVNEGYQAVADHIILPQP
jgi:hypothetical protein